MDKNELNEQMIIRREKLDFYSSNNVNPYANGYRPAFTSENITSIFDKFSKEELDEKKNHVSIAGRIMTKRGQGKAGFATCRDFHGEMQVYVAQANISDLELAWKICAHVKSNAIVFCGDGMTLGVGAGQMSRIDSARIASIKAQNAGLTLQNSAVASDAFFPFRDGLDVVVDAGATCVIQPGGSMRDDEVVAAADERGVAMVYTGTRHFRH